jgi:hypothetical protein
MAARVAKNNIERRENKLFAARYGGTALSRHNVISADNGTGWTFGLRLDFLLKALGEVKPLT